MHSIETAKDVIKTEVQEITKMSEYITDDDIRRAMEDGEDEVFRIKAYELMSISPLSISLKIKLAEAELVMDDAKVNSLLVVDESKPVGVVQIYDLNK